MTRLLRLENVAPDDIKPVLDRLRGRDGDLTSYAPTNTLVITNLASNVRRMDEVARRLLDVPLGGQRIFIIALHRVARARWRPCCPDNLQRQGRDITPERFGQPARAPTLLETLVRILRRLANHRRRAPEPTT